MNGAGMRIGRYVLGRRIAAGGMGEVFEATMEGESGFCRAVAIKRLLPEFARDPEMRTMFVDEAMISASLSHSNIVQVLDYGTYEDAPYLVMERIHGLDLATLQSLVSVGDDISVALRVVRELLRGLHYVHTHQNAAGEVLGIVHRDVSPHNVLLTVSGEVKLTDFGIARASERLSRTRTGTLKGKIAYLAPEQVMHGRIDVRTDVYAAALVAFELITKERYLAGDREIDLLEAARHPKARSLSERRIDVPPELDRVIARALNAAPEERYPSADDFGAAVDDVAERCSMSIASPEQLAELVRDAMDKLSAQDQSETPITAHKSRASRDRRPWLGAALIGCLSGAGAVFEWTREDSDSSPPVITQAPEISKSMADLTTPDSPRPSLPVPSPSSRSNQASSARSRARPSVSVDRSSPSADPRRIESTDATATPELAARLIDEVASHMRTLGLIGGDSREVDAALEEARTAFANEQIDRAIDRARAAQDGCRRIKIDRPFIEAKLERIEALVSSQNWQYLTSRPDLERSARTAVALVLSERYGEANREINALAHNLRYPP